MGIKSQLFFYREFYFYFAKSIHILLVVIQYLVKYCLLCFRLYTAGIPTIQYKPDAKPADVICFRYYNHDEVIFKNSESWNLLCIMYQLNWL